MTAIVRALRPGRQRALVQRPRRKIHLASIGAGEAEWLTFCDLVVPAAGASFWTADAVQIADERAADVCAHCHRLLLLSALLTAEHALDVEAAVLARGIR